MPSGATCYQERSYRIPTARTYCMYLSVSALGIEPRRFEALDFKSSVSTNSTIRTESRDFLCNLDNTHTRTRPSCGDLGMPLTLCTDAWLLSNSQSTIDPLSHIDKGSALTLVESFLSVLRDSSTLWLVCLEEITYLRFDAIIDVVFQ